MKQLKPVLLLVLTSFAFLFMTYPQDNPETQDPYFHTDACTDIIVGKNASVDGSVITSHTGCCSECRVHVVPGKKFKEGATAPVYWGLQDVRKPLRRYGEIIGRIPQVKETYGYFHLSLIHI